HHVYISDRAVVIEAITVPAAADVAEAEVSEAISNPAIESDLRAPIAVIENEGIVGPSPVWRRPQVTDFWSEYPGARHPVIILVVVVPSPIARRPDITLAGAKRLIVDRESRGTERN